MLNTKKEFYYRILGYVTKNSAKPMNLRNKGLHFPAALYLPLFLF